MGAAVGDRVGGGDERGGVRVGEDVEVCQVWDEVLQKGGFAGPSIECEDASTADMCVLNCHCQHEVGDSEG